MHESRAVARNTNRDAERAAPLTPRGRVAPLAVEATALSPLELVAWDDTVYRAPDDLLHVVVELALEAPPHRWHGRQTVPPIHLGVAEELVDGRRRPHEANTHLTPRRL